MLDEGHLKFTLKEIKSQQHQTKIRIVEQLPLKFNGHIVLTENSITAMSSESSQEAPEVAYSSDA